MRLTQKDIDILLRDPGYGNANKAKLIFLGNEPGTGGLRIEDFIRKRLNYLSGVKPVVNVDFQPESKIKSPFLQYMARLELHLKYPDRNWFELFPACDSDVRESINVQTRNFSEEPFLLIDLRPLPRPNEGIWPYTNDEICAEDYIKSFRNFHVKDQSSFSGWREKRVDFLKNFFTKETPNLMCIVGVGDITAKRSFFQTIFPDITFERISIGKTSKNRTKMVHKGVAQFEGRNITVLLSGFFDHGRGIRLSGLKMLGEHIKI